MHHTGGVHVPPPPIVAIVGPTASGKTALSLDLAERFGRAVATIRSAIHRAEDRRQKAEDTARPAPLVASQPKGTCRVCHAKNRGLTDGVCRLCIIRAREAAARREDAS